MLPLHGCGTYYKGTEMNLQDFVKTALVDIVVGVANANAELKQHGSEAGSIPVYGDVKGLRTDNNGKQIQTVEFDVALADSSSTDTKGGIGVLLGAVNLGSHGASRGESSSTSRIKFSVPLVLPGGDER